MSIELGDRVKDVVSGFQGIATSYTRWLQGCVRIGVSPEELKDGKPIEGHSYDEGQLVIVQKGVHKPVELVIQPSAPPVEHKSVGGPDREGPDFYRS